MRSTLLTLLTLLTVATYGRGFTLNGRVINSLTREVVPYVAVTIEGQPQRGGVSNTRGEFRIEGVEPGIFKLVGQSLGYDIGYSEDIIVSATTPAIEIEMSPRPETIDSIIVRPSLFRRMVESPVSMRSIGVQQIEKSAGANRDVSRIVQSYPGVAFSPAGYRNDLIVRGGSPSENRFYVDGIEIPNINHFSTEGASGGPVGILNADLIRNIEFYTGAFPVQRGGALSSIMEVTLRDGDPNAQSFKATLGASEVSLSGSGHLSDRTTYLFSLRQSYLQLLFKAIGLPFLPNFIDGQVKIRHRISERDELTFIALAGIDDMTLNESGTTPTAEYILSYLPRIEQETFTTGVRYRHFSGDNSYTVVASHSYLQNSNIKYRDNDESDPSRLNYLIESRDQKSTLRSENIDYSIDNITLRYGAQLDYIQYGVESYQRGDGGDLDYNSYLGFAGWSAHFGAGYRSGNERLSLSAGARLDGASYSNAMARFWRHASPRLSASYSLRRGFSLSGSAGLYHSLPPLTALSYPDNGNLDFTRVKHLNLALEWRATQTLFGAIEGFYKRYDKMLISNTTDTPLADLGTDYGVVGNDSYRQCGVGRSYGVELSGEWQASGRIALVASLTLYRSEYAASRYDDYRPSTWDSRVIFNASGTRFLKRGWSVGAKVSAIGGAPYTPYDAAASSIVTYWDLNGSPAYNYALYNTERLGGYGQLDLRVDKVFYFPKWMLGLYLDIQNVLVSEYEQQSIPISSGELSDDPTRYEMRYLQNVSGTMLPTFGITAQF